MLAYFQSRFTELLYFASSNKDRLELRGNFQNDAAIFGLVHQRIVATEKKSETKKNLSEKPRRAYFYIKKRHFRYDESFL